MSNSMGMAGSEHDTHVHEPCRGLHAAYIGADIDSAAVPSAAAGGAAVGALDKAQPDSPRSAGAAEGCPKARSSMHINKPAASSSHPAAAAGGSNGRLITMPGNEGADGCSGRDTPAPETGCGGCGAAAARLTAAAGTEQAAAAAAGHEAVGFGAGARGQEGGSGGTEGMGRGGVASLYGDVVIKADPDVLDHERSRESEDEEALREEGGQQASAGNGWADAWGKTTQLPAASAGEGLQGMGAGAVGGVGDADGGDDPPWISMVSGWAG